MKDVNGRVVRLGDRVKLWANHYGRVVCTFDDGKFSGRYSRSDWGHLKTGALIELESGEVFHYQDSDEDFEVVPAK